MDGRTDGCMIFTVNLYKSVFCSLADQSIVITLYSIFNIFQYNILKHQHTCLSLKLKIVVVKAAVSPLLKACSLHPASHIKLK